MSHDPQTSLPLESGFNLLVEGKIAFFHPEGINLNLNILHPELADRILSGSQFLFVVLKGYRDLGLSMNMNTGMHIENPKEMEDLALVIRGAVEGSRGAVNIGCRVAGEGPTCYLRLRADAMLLFNEAFDPVDLMQLRNAWRPSLQD